MILEDKNSPETSVDEDSETSKSHGKDQLDTTKPKTDRLLTFNIGKEEFALPLSSVKEIIAIPEMTKVPNAANFLMGLINLRGQVISTIDIAKIFNIEKIDTGERAVIICEHHGDPIGLAVDSVNQVIITAEGKTDSKLPKEANRNNRFLSGVFRQDEHLTVIVDSDKLCNFVQGKREVV